MPLTFSDFAELFFGGEVHLVNKHSIFFRFLKWYLLFPHSFLTFNNELRARTRVSQRVKTKSILKKSKYENIFMNLDVYIEIRQTYDKNQIWLQQLLLQYPV